MRWLCRRRGLALFVLQLLTGSLFIIDTDFLCALSFKIFIISSMINEAACQVLLMWWPWPSFYWCVGQAAVALVISVIGLGSLFTGYSLSVSAHQRSCKLTLHIMRPSLAPCLVIYMMVLITRLQGWRICSVLGADEK